jgi:L-asparaginase/Glu-tRNA(Gln) amidotransferase subunit D
MNIKKVGMELDMNAKTLRFFIDNVQQPIVVTGINRPVKFFVC